MTASGVGPVPLLRLRSVATLVEDTLPLRDSSSSGFVPRICQRVGKLAVRGSSASADFQKPQASPPVGSSSSGSVMLVSDEAPEATCLSKYVAPSGASFGVYSRCMRLSGKAATVLCPRPRVKPEDDPRTEDDRARVRLWHHREMTRQPGRWPGRFPPDGAPYRPGPSPGGCGLRSFSTSAHHPRRFCRPSGW
ncbi:hypothetical protein HNR26_002109 [Rhizobium rosettiformans]|uniref:Uncharacterized protein n=1 Tax=Rhizobium rosettiformans TaxID=1368430 RepID=A0A7W8MCQ4_9HYPH|nr:hypothetical protein [Rhizobium rosettiformans]